MGKETGHRQDAEGHGNIFGSVGGLLSVGPRKELEESPRTSRYKSAGRFRPTREATLCLPCNERRHADSQRSCLATKTTGYSKCSLAGPGISKLKVVR